VQVVVRPPIFCDWSDEELTERVAEVRQLYVDTLAAWPGDRAPAPG
jgi:putative phosphoserine phosphatase/1-acylglycerol-3-phosphate O-acyltransferase